MAEGKRISDEDLKASYEAIPESYTNHLQRSVALAGIIIRFFLGQEWFDQYIRPEGRKHTFLTVDEADPRKKDISIYHLLGLAELLVNLQGIDGFDGCIQRLRGGDIEGAHAELDFGRMLSLFKIPFRYIVPQGIAGMDYDIEFFYPNGIRACAEKK